MAVGSFYNLKKNYALTFTDDQGSFVVEAHLKELSTQAAMVQGLDASDKNLEILCSNPKEGNPRIRDGMKAAISPDFDGLQGSFVYHAKPQSRFIPVVNAIGVKLYGRFVQDPGSVDEGAGWEVWELRRFVADGGLTLTGGPSGEYQSLNVKLQFIANPGNELDDFGPLNGKVIALAGTLERGDILTHPIHGVRTVQGVDNDGAYETGKVV